MTQDGYTCTLKETKEPCLFYGFSLKQVGMKVANRYNRFAEKEMDR
jgi:hypothetical protein